jgi:4-diphosphocytidyl-2-C-methyl-D-erythritol kinase
MITLTAYAKLNLSLRVGSREAVGMHPLLSLAQSVDVRDHVTVSLADTDTMTITGDDGLPVGDDNLAWRAASEVRIGLGDRRSLAVGLEKGIPVAAGLGGGSADAAAALVATAATLGGSRALVEGLAPSLGSDVPFCLAGGTLWFSGHGETLRRADVGRDYHIAVATAPITVDTGSVFRRWDELGGPEGPEVAGRSVPPTLREVAPLVNDLTPAAVSLHPELGDWIADVSSAWAQPVLVSGSGPTVFGFFAERHEADQAAEAITAARFASGGSPVDRGWDGDLGGTLPPPPWGVV